MVCRGGMALLSTGMTIGSVAAVIARRLFASQLFGVSVSDRVTWVAVLGIVGVMGLIATALPAWRAARQSPAHALRSE